MPHRRELYHRLELKGKRKMKELKLWNTAHPLAESGKPIFIPFGEWRYDDTRRQRLDRAHGEKIANELNERVAKGEPGIPVYQGHPDVPELASKYPDKGALGWVTHAELANEGGRDGLALTVEWDRDPGMGFRWFSPYWFANESERQGNVHVVGKIASIGLVNNPNIAEFRLANEADTNMKTRYSLPPRIVELAAKFDRLANEANFDESKHPRADDGKWTDGPNTVVPAAELKKRSIEDLTKINDWDDEKTRKMKMKLAKSHEKTMAVRADIERRKKNIEEMKKNIASMKGDIAKNVNTSLKNALAKKDRAAVVKAHMFAITSGLKWNAKTKSYE